MPVLSQVLLFVPVCTLAPLCAGLDVQREAWLRLVLWTLERAGALRLMLLTIVSRACLYYIAEDSPDEHVCSPTSNECCACNTFAHCCSCPRCSQCKSSITANSARRCSTARVLSWSQL